MINRTTAFLTTLSLILLQTSSTDAAIVVDLVPDSSAIDLAGGSIPVTVRMTGDAGDNLTAYDLFIDISGVDLNATGTPPVSISNIQPLSLTNGINFFTPELPAGGGIDFGARGGSFSDPESIATGLDLFSFTANFAAQSSPQSFTFQIDGLAPGSSINLGFGPIDLSSVEFNQTMIDIVAVPEPGSGFVGACILSALFLARRRSNNSRRLSVSQLL